MANKFILVPEDIYRGLTTSDVGEPNLDFTRRTLEKTKKRKGSESSTNVHYNQELRRYLQLRNERENRPVKVEVVNKSKGVIIPKTNSHPATYISANDDGGDDNDDKFWMSDNFSLSSYPREPPNNAYNIVPPISISSTPSSFPRDRLTEGLDPRPSTSNQPREEKVIAQAANEGKIKSNENISSQKPLKTDVQKKEIKNEKSKIIGEKVIVTPKPSKIEKDVINSPEKVDIERIKKTVLPPVITPLFSLGLPQFEEEENNKTKEEEELEFIIENEQVLDDNNYRDSSKFLLWRGGIRLSGNLTLLKNIIDSIEFEYNIDFAKFRLIFTHLNIDHISLSPQLGYVLGFENTQNIKNKEIAKYGCDLRGGFSSFAVYANGLTENMIIGNSLSSLLRVVSVSGATPGEYNEKIYDTPIYAHVLPREINEIQIELRTLDNGRLVPFAYGKVLIVLIFKKGSGLEGSSNTYNYFKGASPFQRGYGLQGGAGIGDVLRGLWRFFLPLVRRVGTTVSAEALNTGQRVLERVNQGENIKEALTSEGKKGIDTLLEKGGLPKQFGSGGPRKSIKDKRKNFSSNHKIIIGKVNKKRIRSDAFGLY
uniref:Uncharacterized protein n=1 Tax=Meloidogyne hapla TaxID=6305 RepID=A0A1I8BXY5_MELHA